MTVNLSPADRPKEGSHFDLPTALAVLTAPPAAGAAAEDDRALLWPKACGGEAAWVGATQVLAAASLAEALNDLLAGLSQV